MVDTLWWQIGAGVFFSGPWFLIFHIVMIGLDHRRHRTPRSTMLAVIWPMLCIPMIFVLQGPQDPPLFGVPLIILFATVWWRNGWIFLAGLISFYGLSAALVVLRALSGAEVHWPFLMLWPVSLLILFSWRSIRMRGLTMASAQPAVAPRAKGVLP